MSHDEMAAPWPLIARLAMMKGEGRGRGRHSHMDHLERLAALREFRGGPWGDRPPFGGPGRGGPGRGGPFGGGRGRRRRGDVRTALLMLLAEEPRNGYQLMQIIEERSGGRWRPSPGSVYPTLAQLEDEGLIRAVERDGTKLLEITDTGRERLAESKTDPAPWEPEDQDDDPQAHSLSEIASLVIQIGKAAWQVAQEGDERQTEKARQTLAETRRALYRILAQDEDEQDSEV
ncbi:MAG: helix-turn-helix transcriptional regulator [Solirubrobacterales bacterium]|nr:helix-turn-helix transcriptional regulator [Solirubrobacterales bacterium]